MAEHDYDWLVIGSGFGGSVAALRLREKGYSVGVLECGRRFGDDDFPKSTWDLRRYFWAPKLGMRGIFRMSTFKDVAIVSGAGVGGGSLGYANTLYRARRRFYEDPQWADLADWESALAPHYDEAERMLGVVAYDRDDPADDLLREFAREIGVEDTYAKTRVGVLLAGTPGETVPDPFFGGAGPDRTVCERCGRCMIGCPVGAKNTLVKNYLWLAEHAGAEVFPERMVVDVEPLGAHDGSEGYEVTTEHPGAWLRRRRRAFTARGVVFAAGPLGTNKLLASCKLHGSLPRLSDRIGELVRTNSEAILAVTLPPGAPDIQSRVAITGSIYPDPETHIETVVYGDAADSMSSLYTVLVGDGTRVTRPLKLLGAAARHPLTFLRLLDPRGWSRRTIIVLVMQTLDNAIELRARRTRRGARLQTRNDSDRPIPTFIPVANQFAAWLAKRTGGTAQTALMEAIANIPTTAHVLGGAVIGADPSRGVVDARQRVFGYENLLVCDGSAVPANIGVNPSLTITAMAEHAMSHIPPAPGYAPDVTSRAKASNTST
jgi:cholesterol oxidase